MINFMVKIIFYGTYELICNQINNTTSDILAIFPQGSVLKL